MRVRYVDRVAAAPGEHYIRRVPPRPVLALFLCLFANQSGTLVLSPILVEVARDFDVSTAAAGQLRAVSGVAAGTTALAVGMLARRVGLRGLILSGLALLATGCLLSAAAPAFAVLALAQVPVGVAVGLLLSGSVVGVAEWVPRHARARALSWVFAGQAAAWIVGMPAIGVVGEASWRYAWLAVPLAAAVVAFAAASTLPATPARPTQTGGLRALARDRDVAAWAVGELFAYAAWAGMLVYAGALLIESYGASLRTTGFLLGAAMLAYFPGGLLFRRWVDRRSRGLLVGLGLAGAAGVALVGALRPAVWVSALLLAAFVFVNAGRTIAGSSFGLDAARERQVAAMGVRTAATHFGYLVGASVGGVALHVGGYPAVGIAFAALYLLAVAPHVVLVGLRRARMARAGA